MTGLPVANRLSYLTCPDCEDSGLEMIFDRGLGIVEVGRLFRLGLGKLPTQIGLGQRPQFR